MSTRPSNLAYSYESAPGSFSYFNFAQPAYAFNAVNYRQFEYGTTSDDNRETALTTRANFAWNMDGEDAGFGAAAGAYARFLDRRYDYQVDNYRTNTTSNHLLTTVLAPETYAAYNGRGQTMLLIDPDAARAAFDATRAGFTANTANAGGSLQSEYDLAEDIYAGYAMARYAGNGFRLSAGVRYEDTTLSTGSNRLRSGAYTYGRLGQHYRDWLPSAQFDWDLTDRLRFRAAFSRTLGRPNYDDLAARETVAIGVTSNNPDGGISITSGNPTLKSRRSSSYDVSLEYYVNRDILFSAAGFIKQVDDEIVTVRNQATELFRRHAAARHPHPPGQRQRCRHPRHRAECRGNADALPARAARRARLLGQRHVAGRAAAGGRDERRPGHAAAGQPVRKREHRRQRETVLHQRAGDAAGGVESPVAILFSISTTDPLADRRYASSDLFDAQLRLKLNRHWTIVAQGKNLTNERPQRMFGPNFGLLREEINNGRAFYIGALVRY